jgi:hypothetical protein
LRVRTGLRHPAVLSDLGFGVAGLDDDHADANDRTSGAGIGHTLSANLDAR